MAQKGPGWSVFEIEGPTDGQLNLPCLEQPGVEPLRGFERSNTRVRLKAANVVGAPRANFYRWKKAFRELGPRGLEPKSRQPKNLRQRRWDAAVVNGGSEFMAEFEDACREKGIPLHVLAPKSPELNGGVERLNRTWRDEFYDLYGDLPTKLAELRLETQNHQCIINHVRPHEALDLKTPAEYLDENYPEWAPQSHM